MTKTKVSKLWFSMVVVFVVVLTVSLADAKSLRKGEEYKEKSGEAIRVVSSDEVEIERGPDILLGKYTVDGERVRIVANVFGATLVIYYKITPDGLVEEKTGKIYYSKTGLAAVEEKRKRAGEEQRKAALAAEKKRKRAEQQKAKAATALIEAAAKGNIELTKTLLSKGADVNAKGDDGLTALIAASSYGHTEIVKMLLAKGADLNAVWGDSGTALGGASANGHTEIVKMLIAKGADLNAVWGPYSGTALGAASSQGHTEIVKMLIAKGADVKHASLFMAADRGYIEVVKMLLDKGVNVNTKSSDEGKTALICAAGEGHAEIVKMLLDKGADVSIKDGSGKTVFDHTQDPKILEMLNEYAAQKQVAEETVTLNVIGEYGAFTPVNLPPMKKLVQLELIYPSGSDRNSCLVLFVHDDAPQGEKFLCRNMPKKGLVSKNIRRVEISSATPKRKTAVTVKVTYIPDLAANTGQEEKAKSNGIGTATDNATDLKQSAELVKKIIGKVIAVNTTANTVTVKGREGESTCEVSADTEIREIGGGKLANVKVGDRTICTYVEKDGKSVCKSLKVGKRRN